MKENYAKGLIVCIVLAILLPGKLFAQALPPVISYSGPQTYNLGTPITPLSPASSGVAAPGYTTSPVTLASNVLNPYEIAVDGPGNVYVAAYGGNAVLKFPVGGGSAISLGSGFMGPTGVAVDSAGNVYVADYRNNAIKEIPVGGGAPVILGSGFNEPYAVAVDPLGNVYVADYGNNAVKKIPVGGGAPVVIGSGFNHPFGVAADATGNVFVGDIFNNAVKEIPVGGGAPISLGSGFSGPRDVTTDASGNVYVADFGNKAVKKIPVGGASPIIIGGTGITGPVGVAVDAAGKVYVTDYTNNAVKVITPIGGYYIHPALPAGLTFDGATGIISGTPTQKIAPTTYTITAYNTNGSSSANVIIAVNILPAVSYSSPQTYTAGVTISPLIPVTSAVDAPGYSTSPITVGSGFNQPMGITSDVAGNLYVADAGNNAIKKIPAGGGAPISLGSGFADPYAVTLDATGSVYVADYGNNAVEKIPAGGGAPIKLATVTKPTGLAIDPAGNITVAKHGTSSNLLISIPADGGSDTIVYFGGRISNYPFGVAIDAAGNIYATGQGDNAVKQIPVIGGAPVTFATGFNNPDGLTVDNLGNVFVADAGNNAVKKIAQGGTPVSLGAGFNSPAGVTVDAMGDVFVADELNNAIKEIKPVGGYYISPALPVGMSFDQATGIISGTPDAASAATTYTVTAFNNYGSGNTTLIITVNLPPLPALSYGGAQTDTIGTAIIPLTPAATGVTPAQTYHVSTTRVGSGFDRPQSIAADAAGNVYVGNFHPFVNATLQKVPAGGGAPVTLYTGSYGISGIAVDGAGNVYAMEYQNNNNIYKISPGGTSVVIATGFNGQEGLAVDAAGNVYVCDQLHSAVKMFPVGGGAPVAVGSGFSFPGGVAVDAAGNIYVADSNNSAVKKIPAGGGTPVTIGSGFNHPDGIAVDAAGNVYIADTQNNEVKLIPAGGGTPVTIGSGYNGAFSVAVDAAGNVYVADYWSNAVQKITPSGGYYISPALPAGLSFNNSTGVISGTPTAIFPATSFSVTGYNTGGGSSTTVSVKVVASTNADLSGLYLSSGTLSPAFKSAKTGYTASVANTTNSITITPTTANAGATLKVNGVAAISGNTSQSLPLVVGLNTITAVVTAQDGVTKKTYTINVTRAASGNAKLSSFSTNAGVLSPAFNNTITSYTKSVGNTVTSITVTPTTADPNASVTVNGAAVTSGMASPAIPLTVGNNVINTVVTAQNGVTKITYTVTVNRAASSDATLSKLSLSTGTIKPAFTPATTAYSVAVGNGITSVTVTPTTTDAGATVKVNGVGVTSGSASGPISLVVGTNTIYTIVTAQNGANTRTYKIIITRAASTNASLLKLTTSHGGLTPAFTHTTYSYSKTLTIAVSVINFTPTAQDSTATITVNGLATPSGAASPNFPLSVGANVFPIVVTAQDGKTTLTYTVTVTQTAPNANIVNESISVGKPMPAVFINDDGINVHPGLSPNGDGINDYLIIENIAAHPDNKLQVMNRSGQLVFEARGYDNTTKVFDGHSNKTGAMQLPGTYFYSLDYTVKGEVKHKTGFIVLKY